MPVELVVSGKYACFTRPELKVERVSYEVMTPSAARGILEAIHWKPVIRWIVEEISVLKPIQFQTLRRNEIGEKVPARSALIARNAKNIHQFNLEIEENRQQRASAVLVDVSYIIKARIELSDTANANETPQKHLEMFKRRAGRGQCFNQPYLGTREFPAYFNLRENDKAVEPPISETRHLGIMLLDIDYRSQEPLFFEAQLEDGVMKVPSPASQAIIR